jgi:hypothetical protein
VTTDHLFVGATVEQIQAQFGIVAAEAAMLSPARAEQFHTLYKGVVAPALFAGMVQELASGDPLSASNMQATCTLN